MIHTLKRIVSDALRTRGFAVVRIHERNLRPTDQRCGFFHLLDNLGFDPKYIVDVGANRGNWSRDAIRYFPKSRYTLLEPNEALADYLNDLLERPNVEWLKVGAGLRSETLRFTIAEHDDSSSFAISEQDAVSRGLQQVEIPVISLNDLVSERENPIPELVKIDAEGLDIEVIRGATELYGETEIFCVEAGFAPSNSETSLHKVIAIMEEIGYLPFDITELNRSPVSRVLWLCEICFILRDSELLKALRYR